MRSASHVLDSARGSGKRKDRFERIYVWEFPIRVFHLVNALTLCVLFATGLYMANPVLISSGEAYENFVMGRVREVHFISAFLFTISFVLRAVWYFMGNDYARSGTPYFWKASWWRDLIKQAVLYLQLETGRPHLGHNAVAGFAYTIFIIGLGALQIFTGYALYAQSDPGSWLDSAFGWVIPLFGGGFNTLMWHHLAAWGFVVFVIIHVYIIMLDGREYRNGLLGSIIHGNKFRRVPEESEAPEDDE